MKIYTLIHVTNVADICESDASLYTDKETARKTMLEEWKRTVDMWSLDSEKTCHVCSDDSAYIKLKTNEEKWHIEETEIDVDVAIEVAGGLVQSVYANANVSVDVFDYDIVDTAANAKDRLKTVTSQNGWTLVW